MKSGWNLKLAVLWVLIGVVLPFVMADTYIHSFATHDGFGEFVVAAAILHVDLCSYLAYKLWDKKNRE